MAYIARELIKKKRDGAEHDRAELEFLVQGLLRGEVADYQISAWLMAVFYRGMSAAETAALTDVMLHSGRVLDFSSLGCAVDKHSTGGVGDKTSMILAPIAAAAGVPVPMIAGRGLGHTGGTLDKLESIPGFNVGLSLDAFASQITSMGLAIIGQTQEICPADKRIYAIRDVTATIESDALICASIMSKKMAEGIGALVLDVKFGSGAFMKSLELAETLAQKLMAIGAAHGKRVTAMLTNMQQPLGCFAGNALEIGECIGVLQNQSYLARNAADFADTRELSLRLAGEMIWLGGKAEDRHQGYELAKRILNSGQAWEKFVEICRAQGGDLRRLPTPRPHSRVFAASEGFIAAFDGEKIGVASLAIGAGRKRTEDKIDYTAGVEFHCKIGDSVKIGDPLFTLYGEADTNDLRFADARAALLRATSISLQKSEAPDLIAKVLQNF